MSPFPRALCKMLATSALAALGACNLAPAYHPPAMPQPAPYKPIDGWATAAPADTLPRGAWWALFRDPVLDELERRLDSANPDLQAALARYDEARAYVQQSKAGLLPSAGIEGAATQNRQSDDRPLRGSGQPDAYGADQLDGVARYEFDFWGRLRNQLRDSKAQAQASAADRATIQLSLEAQLASAYFQLRGLDADTALLTQTVAAYETSLALTQTLYSGKIAARMDVSRASVQLDNARTAAADIAARRSVMANALAVLAGEHPSLFTLPTDSAAPVLPQVPVGLPATLLQRRPDVASAERSIAAANAGIGVARAAFYPTITFNAGGGVMSQGTNPFNPGDIFWSLGPSISLPLFEGGRLKGQRAQAYARFHEASAHYRSTALNAFKEVEDNRALIARLEQEAGFSRKATLAAAQTASAAMALYTNGATSYLDVVTAQTALFQAQQAALDIQTRQFVATVSLIRALGGGWEETEYNWPAPPRDMQAASAHPDANHLKQNNIIQQSNNTSADAP